MAGVYRAARAQSAASRLEDQTPASVKRQPRQGLSTLWGGFASLASCQASESRTASSSQPRGIGPTSSRAGAGQRAAVVAQDGLATAARV
jgi:hypothetical protein